MQKVIVVESMPEGAAVITRNEIFVGPTTAAKYLEESKEVSNCEKSNSVDLLATPD